MYDASVDELRTETADSVVLWRGSAGHVPIDSKITGVRRKTSVGQFPAVAA
jgi:hypothetical protein